MHVLLLSLQYLLRIGNSGGNLHKYWAVYFNRSDHPRIQGGFIWDWADQGEIL
jgi:beta-galactosidase